MKTKDAIVAMQKAVKAAGGPSELSRKAGVSRRSVYNWMDGITLIDPLLVEAVEAATGVSRHELRPDLSRIFRDDR